VSTLLPKTKRDRSPESGSVTPFVTVLCAALLALLAVVVDGGRALDARENALGEAEQAARLGAAQLSAASLRAGVATLAAAEAIGAAEAYMTAAGHPGTAVVMGTSVVATVRKFRLNTPLLALVGIDTFPISASASATSVVG